MTTALLAGCGAGLATGGEDQEVTLTVATFGVMGFDDLYEQYEKTHPGVTIEATNYEQSGDARATLFEGLENGEGMSDVVALEEGWLGQAMAESDKFVDLRDHHIETSSWRWLEWKYKQGTAPTGAVIGAGTDIGPMGLCYRRDLFEAAGLPTDRKQVAELFQQDGGDWERYFEVGRQYHATTGKAWYDQPTFVWNAMVNQLDEGYYNIDGDIIAGENEALAEKWGLVAQANADGLSARETPWDWRGGKAFTDDSFATFMCPGWMIGHIKTQLEAAGGGPETGWDFADVFPGGSANWGGSFLAVPESSEHPDEAAELVLWLTEAEQQAEAFKVAGTFPSTEEMIHIFSTEPVDGDPVFGGAPIAKLLAQRTEGVRAQFKGPLDSQIQEDAFGDSLRAMDAGDLSPDEAWQQAIGRVQELETKGSITLPEEGEE
ncbi:ABC transporter substrate-binding protein [Myceligenerans crystallogenes]|uniref:ABC transporter substrate-binding protein n=1 Tax=Myceligenerans crystallogenes TaxID=316335 RepID=A0ABN2NAG1_9MICO